MNRILLRLLCVLLFVLHQTELSYSCAATAPGDTTDCTSCTAITEQTGGTASPTIVEGTTNGCTTYTVSCTGPTGGDAVLDFYSGGTSVGVSGPETGTITRVVTCSTTGELILTEEGNEISVDTVQCVAI